MRSKQRQRKLRQKNKKTVFIWPEGVFSGYSYNEIIDGLSGQVDLINTIEQKDNSIRTPFDKQLLELKKGELFIESRGLIVRFDDMGGDLDKKILLNNVSMTSCANTSDGWELVSERIEIDDITKRGKAEKVKIKIFDQTFIKLPYLPFATSSDRMTGFLEPTLSYSSDGLDFMIPYFKVISEKSDLTLAARNISERGFGFEGNIRAVHGDNKHLRNFDFIYFNKDKEYQELYP